MTKQFLARGFFLAVLPALFLTLMINPFSTALADEALPSKYVELNDYVITAPNQGQVNTCLFMAATGAMEILLNKKAKIKNPKAHSDFDISELDTIL